MITIAVRNCKLKALISLVDTIILLIVIIKMFRSVVHKMWFSWLLSTNISATTYQM